MLNNLKKTIRPRAGKLKRKLQVQLSFNAFQRKIIETLIQQAQQTHENNFDPIRFPDQNAESLDIENKTYFYSHYLRNAAKFEKGYELLEDERSKELFLKIIAYRILGHKSVKLLDDLDEHWALRKKAADLKSSASDLQLKGNMADFKRYEFEHNGQNIVFEGQHTNIAWSFFIKQYHYERDGVSIKPEEGDYVVDAGACYGDTALSFATYVGNKGKVYSFDFMSAHVKAIKNNIKLNPWAKDTIKLMPYAVGGTSNKVELVENEDDEMRSGASLVSTPGLSANAVPMRSIDDLHKSGEIEKVDFIKMDIEGFEVPALKGAKHVIKKFKPKLAISVYHKTSDFYIIPKLIKSINPDYKLYLDHYTPHAEETVLYAISDR